MMVKWMALLMLDGAVTYPLIINHAQAVPVLPGLFKSMYKLENDDAHPLEHSINTCLLIELTQGTFLS